MSEKPYYQYPNFTWACPRCKLKQMTFVTNDITEATIDLIETWSSDSSEGLCNGCVHHQVAEISSEVKKLEIKHKLKRRK